MATTACTKLSPDVIDPILKAADLPSMPAVTLQILQLASHPDTGTEQVAKVATSDPALSARMLKLANSVLYNRGAKFTTVARAAAHLGIMQVRSMAMAMHLFSIKPRKDSGSFDYAYYWRYCLTSATAARTVAQMTRLADPDEAFTAGLLQDLGVLAMQQACPHRYEGFFLRKHEFDPMLWEREQAAWGYDHAALGQAIAERWGLPETITEAIGAHHDPGDNKLARVCQLADAVHFTVFDWRTEGTDHLAECLSSHACDHKGLLLRVQQALPAIADACACPQWDASSEKQLKERIATLVGDGASIV